MKKVLFLIIFLFPFSCWAQNINNKSDIVFRARVIEILNQQKSVLSDGTEVEQQDIKLKGLEGEFLNKEIIFKGIGDYDVVAKNIYNQDDKVLVVASYDDQGEVTYYITDYVRNDGMLWLTVSFVLTLLFVAGFKGIRAILSLVLTFLVIIKYLIPQILAGSDPLLITFIASLLILLIIIYVTEGFCLVSHLSVASIFISLSVTIFLSWLFVEITHLSGFSGEEMAYLVNIGGHPINFRGLLLAGIIIGALGVLDDVVISQIASVEQITQANPFQSRREIFKSAYKIGVSHISSMANTLFLAYAGVSLPLLILFVSGKSAFSSWGQVVNNEAIATEIVRTMTGSIGLILSVPIATALAVWWFKKNNNQ